MSNEWQKHWETIYALRQPEELSWTEERPQTSLDFIHSFNLAKTAKIIDIGGGDSRLVDCLLEEGFRDITVLDISAKSLERAKKRLGNKARKVKWVVSGILDYDAETTYDLWHDRAAFHFLTAGDQIKQYVDTARRMVAGFLILGTFSQKGPSRCSGLKVKQYGEAELQDQLANGFQKIRCITTNHITPFHTKQNFLFCSFRKKNPPDTPFF